MPDIQTETMSSTPYDDVFKTMCNDLSELIIPLINEVFGVHYGMNEVVYQGGNEHFFTRPDDSQEKRTVDAFFYIGDNRDKIYHLECQCNPDNTMVVRIFEYDVKLAIETAVITGSKMQIRMPQSAVLYLRSNKNTPTKMEVEILAPNGKTLSYEMPTIRMRDYDIDSIFEKKLYFLIPFVLFNFEHEFDKIESNEEARARFVNDFRKVSDKLSQCLQDKKLTMYQAETILQMIRKVTMHLAQQKQSVKEGVYSIMGGHILNYEAKEILNQGIAQGIEQGIEQGIAQGIEQGITQGIEQGITQGEEIATERDIIEGIKRAINKQRLSLADAMDYMDIPVEQKGRYEKIFLETYPEVYQAD